MLYKSYFLNESWCVILQLRLHFVVVIIMEYDMRNTPVETSEQNHADLLAVQQELLAAQKEILDLQSQIQWLERSYE